MPLDGNPYLNITGYCLTELDKLAERRATLRKLCSRLEIQGTVLISAEGIHLTLSGRRSEIDELIEELRKDPKLAGLQVQEKWSGNQSFDDLQVRVKKEIFPNELEEIKLSSEPDSSQPTQESSFLETHPSWLEFRREAIAKVIESTPGSIPYENRRPIRVPARAEGATVLDFLRSIQSILPESEWLDGIRDQRLLLKGQPVSADQILKAGEELVWITPGTVEPEVNLDIQPVYEDDAILVIYKPAPLPMHPCGRFNRNSLDYVLRQAMHPYRPRPAHRLDANTCGLLVLAKTRQFAGRLQPQFESGSVFKEYLVKVEQAPEWKSITVNQPISARPANSAGGRVISEDGVPALTDFEAVGPASDHSGFFLLARPKTGRTNQIRAHLWSLGAPVKNDPHYLKNRQTGATLTLSVNEPPMGLCSYRLEFNHPLSRDRVKFISPIPDWAKSCPIV